jgi:hypothetical protein
MKTQCPHCNARFNTNEKNVGKQAKCPTCSKPFVIEPFVEPPASPAKQAEPVAVKPPAKAPEPVAPPAAPPPPKGPQPVAAPAKTPEAVEAPAEAPEPAEPPAEMPEAIAPPAKGEAPVETPAKSEAPSAPSVESPPAVEMPVKKAEPAEPPAKGPEAIAAPAAQPTAKGPQPVAAPAKTTEAVEVPAEAAEPAEPPPESPKPVAPPAEGKVPAQPPAKDEAPIRTPIKSPEPLEPAPKVAAPVKEEEPESKAVSKKRLSKVLFVYFWMILQIIAGGLGALGLVLAIRKEAESTLIAVFAAAAASLIFSLLIELAMFYKMWAAIRDNQVSISPAKAVGFLFIPLFNIYWAFYMVTGFAEDYNSLILRRSVKARNLPLMLFLIYALMFMLSVIFVVVPVVCAAVFSGLIARAFIGYPDIFWILIGVVSAVAAGHFITYLLFAVKTCNAINALPDTSAGGNLHNS